MMAFSRRGMPRAGAAMALLLVLLGTGVSAQTGTADRVRNVETAATEIAAIQKKSGSEGAFAAIDDCYRRELARATALTRHRADAPTGGLHGAGHHRLAGSRFLLFQHAADGEKRRMRS